MLLFFALITRTYYGSLFSVLSEAFVLDGSVMVFNWYVRYYLLMLIALYVMVKFMVLKNWNRSCPVNTILSFDLLNDSESVFSIVQSVCNDIQCSSRWYIHWMHLIMYSNRIYYQAVNPMPPMHNVLLYHLNDMHENDINQPMWYAVNYLN